MNHIRKQPILPSKSTIEHPARTKQKQPRNRESQWFNHKGSDDKQSMMKLRRQEVAHDKNGLGQSLG